jgi:metalloendopeptidase OMA1, mitochondrial
MTFNTPSLRPLQRLILTILLLTTVTAEGCYYPESRSGNQDERGPGDRPQPLALTPRQELQVGRQAYQEVLEKYRDHLLPNDDPSVRRVRAIVAKLVRASEIEPLGREINLRLRGYQFEWQANVVDSDTINAFCLPAGKIIVFTGILKLAGDKEDFWATILSHEMSHALAHHASERVARQGSAGGVLRSLSYDRMQESEADHIGIFLMGFAGFDPTQAPLFWKKMHAAHGAGGGLPPFLSDHPSDESRMENLEKWAPKVLAAKHAYDRGRIAPAGR